MAERAPRRGRRRAAAGVSLAVMLLAGCASDPRADLRDRVADVIAAANDGDPDAVRRTAEALISEVQAQATTGDLGGTEANALLELARQVQADAALLEPPPPPPPPSPTPSASPTPSRSPSPSPSRSPSPSPSPTPEPEPTEEPEPSQPPPPSSPAPIVSISPVASSSPSASPSRAQAGPPAKPGKKSPSPSPRAAR